MIRLYEKVDNINTSNGDVVLKPLKALLYKEDNGDYYVDVDVSLLYAEHIADGKIIAVNTPTGDQMFRICNPKKTHTKVSFRAWHIFYDSKNYLIADAYVEDKACAYALSHLNSKTEPASQYSTNSDIATQNSFRCVRKSLYEAVQTVLERWGGHLVRDNLNIEIRNSIGADNGVTVRYKKNIKTISYEENWDNVITKILPVGKDGTLLNAVNKKASIYIESDTQYEIPYTKTVSFNQDIDRDDYPSDTAYLTALVNDLRAQAQTYLDENALPKINYTLKANLEKITDIGDVVEVIDERLGVNIMTNVISYTYDCILNKYTAVEFGNFREKTLRNFVQNITKNVGADVDQKISFVEGELREATESIMNMMGQSYVIYDGNQIMVVDKLPKEEATNVLRINSGGIGFSTSGINGTFNSAWLINGTMDMQNINVINLTADVIKGGTLTIGGVSNVNGQISVVDASNNVIGSWNKDGLVINKGSITGSDIKLGGQGNKYGKIELYNASDTLEAALKHDGLLLYREGNYIGKIGYTVYGSGSVAASIRMAEDVNSFVVNSDNSEYGGWRFNRDLNVGITGYDKYGGGIVRITDTAIYVDERDSSGSYRSRLWFSPTSLYATDANYKRAYEISRNGLAITDSAGTRRFLLDASGLKFYDAGGNLTKTYSAT